MTQVNSCTVCKGVGGCPSCRGAGVLNGKRCLMCRGSGTCPVCARAFDPNAVPPPPVEAEPVRFTVPAVAVSAVLVGSVDPLVTVHRRSSAKLTARAVLALLFLIAFYVFALGTAGLLLIFTWLQIQLLTQPRAGGGGGYYFLATLILPPFGALAIILAIYRGRRTVNVEDVNLMKW